MVLFIAGAIIYRKARVRVARVPLTKNGKQGSKSKEKGEERECQGV
jgi:hypothetical protein